MNATGRDRGVTTGRWRSSDSEDENMDVGCDAFALRDVSDSLLFDGPNRLNASYSSWKQSRIDSMIAMFRFG
jgi:hypothetical protein